MATSGTKAKKTPQAPTTADGETTRGYRRRVFEQNAKLLEQAMTKKSPGPCRGQARVGNSFPGGDATPLPVPLPERIRAIDAVMTSADFGDGDGAPPETARWSGGFQLVPASRPLEDVVRLPAGPTPDGATGALLVPLLNQFALMQQQMFDQFQQVILAMMQTMTALHHEQTELISRELAQVGELTRHLCTLQASAARLPAGTTVPGRAAPALPELDIRGRPVPRSSAEVPPVDAEAAVPAIHVWLTQRIAAIQGEREGRLQRILGLILGRS
jgi:hypothetical protein